MIIFKSRQVNLDPEIIKRLTIGGWTVEVGRPEFEPTRDPEPWVITNEEWDYEERHATEDEADLHSLQGDRVAWAPRREQFDTPVNRVLVAFRKGFPTGDKYEVLLNLESQWAAKFTDDEIDHARRVLTRLANWGTS